MRLVAQTLLAGAATLVVPALGWQVVRELDASLLDGRAAAQELAAANLRAELAAAVATDGSLARTLRLGARPRAADEPYALGIDAPLVIDGYDEDWPAAAPAFGAAGLVARAAVHAGALFLVVEAEDATPVWHRPPPERPDAGELERPSAAERLSNGDALEVFVETPGGARRHALLSPTAPGELPPVAGSRAPAAVPTGGARPAGSPERAGRALPRWRAAWEPLSGGWRAELELPVPPVGSRLGIAALDARDGSAVRRWRGTLDPVLMRALRREPARAAPRTLPPLHRPAPGLASLADRAVGPGTRLRLFDAGGRLLADVDRLNLPGAAPDGADAPFASVWDALLFRVFAWLVAGDLPLPLERAPAVPPLHLDAVARAFARGAPVGAFDAGAPAGTRRYVTAERDRVIGTLERFGAAGAGGHLLLESNEEHSAAYNGARLARLFSLLVLASALATAVALGWSARLSLRLRALSRDAARAVDRDGRVDARALAGAGARDELGELSRDLSELLGRSADYTRHLEALSSRLSHELGTPLAVVRGALENLDRERLDAESATLVARAERGAGELGALLRALVESTRLEGTLGGAERVRVDLEAFARDCVERYRQGFPEVVVTLRRRLEPVSADGDDPNGSAGADALGTGRAAADRGLRAEIAPDALVQALDKLVDNAVDFAADARVELVLAALGTRPADEREARARRFGKRPRPGRRAGGRAVFLGVSNRGPGIDPAILPELFAPMTSGRPGGGHLGLGLDVVRLVARLHGGRPLALERGPWTTIGLVLPIGEGDPAYARSAGPAPARRRTRRA